MQSIQSIQTPDILQQFSDMLKSHSIVVDDREILVKLFENIIELCTQMPKTKLKAAVKIATKDLTKDATTAKKAPVAKKAPAAKKVPAAKKAPAQKPVVEVIGPADAGVCPMESDIAKPVARGRGRPRKSASTDNVVGVETPVVGDAEKKKRGRPKKDKSVMISSNEDEDALIAKMIADVKSMKTQSILNADTDGDDTESDHYDHYESAKSVSPVPIHISYETPMQVEADVSVTKKVTNATKTLKGKATKAPKAPKETAIKALKEKTTKATNAPQNNESIVSAPVSVSAPAPVSVSAPAPVSVSAPAPVSAPVSVFIPLRENKASSDGKFYLMPNFPRSSFSCKGKTYLRTETDNVYDNITFELVGIWDHLNHEIVTTFDEEDIEELWMSDQE